MTLDAPFHQHNPPRGRLRVAIPPAAMCDRRQMAQSPGGRPVCPAPAQRGIGRVGGGTEEHAEPALLFYEPAGVCALATRAQGGRRRPVRRQQLRLDRPPLLLGQRGGLCPEPDEQADGGDAAVRALAARSLAAGAHPACAVRFAEAGAREVDLFRPQRGGLRGDVPGAATHPRGAVRGPAPAGWPGGKRLGVVRPLSGQDFLAGEPGHLLPAPGPLAGGRMGAGGRAGDPD